MSIDESTPTAAPAPEAKKPRRRIWLFALIAVLLLGGGGAGVYWMKGQAAPAEKEAEAEAEPSFVVPFESFVVNLADPGGSRFLRVTLSLEVADHETQESLAEPVIRTHVRSEILELLAQQSSEALITPEGKAALKKSIVEHARKAESHLRITDVFFSEFIVQF